MEVFVRMYSLEQRLYAVDVLMKFNGNTRATIRELGYPNSRQTLSKWYKEFTENGELHKSYIKPRKYTDEDIEYAVGYYLKNGKNITKTVKDIGYPCRSVLSRWITERFPDDPVPLLKGKSLVKYTYTNKVNAVVNLCSRSGSAKEVENETGISRTSLYKWKRQLLSEKAIPKMKKDYDTAENNLHKQVIDLEKQVKELQQQVHKLRLEKDALETASELLKKANGINLQQLSNREKAMIIDALRDRYCLKELLHLFHLAKSSYFYQQEVMKQPNKYCALREMIVRIFQDSRETYGYRRVNAVLHRDSIVVSEKVVRRIMKEEGLKVFMVKKRKYNSYKGEISPAVPNLINRDFHADRPNQKWLTDITEFHIPAGKIYLSPMIDCFDGLPVAWSIGTSPNAELVNTMLDSAISTLAANEHPIVHSDRGCHYRWSGWINRMNEAELVRSMSMKGCTPDNAACEAFFGRLKNEMFYPYSWNNVSLKQFIDILDEYIQWYASKRIKLSLGALSPLEETVKKSL